MYVDDPVLSTAGSEEDCAKTVDLVVTWWRILGLPLAWAKGTFDADGHQWIGAGFRVAPTPTPHAVVTVPERFATELHQALAPFTQTAGLLGKTQVDQVLGRVGRLAYIVPAAKPYVAAMWAAACDTDAAKDQRRKEVPPGKYAARRFAQAATWLRVLLQPPAHLQEGLFPLEAHIVARRPAVDTDAPQAQVDASPWGAGGVLIHPGSGVTEFFAIRWEKPLAAHLATEIGSPSGQTTWEYLALFLALHLWASQHRQTGLQLLGDNLSSLEGVLNLRGKRSLSLITREISWRQTRYSWKFAVGHLPTEANVLADCLSRLHAPAEESKKKPREIATAVERAIDPMDLWTCS